MWKSGQITRNCFPTCTSCVTSDIAQCTGCYSDYIAVFTVDAVKSNLNTFSCDSDCPDTHYVTTLYNAVVGTYCLPCETLVPNCLKCNLPTPASKAICQQCKTGFYVTVNVQTLFDNNCAKCDAGCLECAGTATNCIACDAGKVLTLDPSSGSYSCANNTDTLPATNRVCPYNKYLYKGQCYEKDCPDGSFRRKYFTDDCASCEVATPGCFKCDKTTGKCITCKPEYKMDTSNLCFLCNQNSLQCCNIGQGTSAGSCSVCTDPNASDCFIPAYSIACNAGYVLNALGVCQIALANCNSYNYQATLCLLCSGTRLQSGGSCVTTCTAPALSYVSNSKLVCQGCESTCTACTMPDTNNRCSTCTSVNGYYLTDSGCAQCPFSVTTHNPDRLHRMDGLHVQHLHRLPALGHLLHELPLGHVPERGLVLELRRLHELHGRGDRQLQRAEDVSGQLLPRRQRRLRSLGHRLLRPEQVLHRGHVHHLLRRQL